MAGHHIHTVRVLGKNRGFSRIRPFTSFAGSLEDQEYVAKRMLQDGESILSRVNALRNKSRHFKKKERFERQKFRWIEHWKKLLALQRDAEKNLSCVLSDLVSLGDIGYFSKASSRDKSDSIQKRVNEVRNKEEYSSRVRTPDRESNGNGDSRSSTGEENEVPASSFKDLLLAREASDAQRQRSKDSMSSQGTSNISHTNQSFYLSNGGLAGVLAGVSTRTHTHTHTLISFSFCASHTS